MLDDDRKSQRRRRRQARYEARQRDGIGVYPVELGAEDIGILIALRCLPEGAERDRGQVAQAIKAMIRSLVHK